MGLKGYPSRVKVTFDSTSYSKKEVEMKNCFFLTLVAVLLTGVFAGDSLSQEPYPTRPVTTVIPFPAGGGTDGAARVFADSISKLLGQPFIVLNKPGASGSVGASFVAKSKPDGYTLGHLASTATLAECFTKYFTADYTSDEFTPVAQWSGYPAVFFCTSDKPFKTMKEFLSYARGRKEEVLFASRGRGEATSLALHMVQEQEGIKNLRYVPFKGDSEILSAVLGNHADFGVVTFSVATPLLAAGKVKILSVVTQDKIPAYPDIPNLFELGYNTGIRQFYLATFLPKGTPDAIVKKLEKTIEQVTRDANFVAKMNNMSMPIIYKTSDQLKGLVQEMKKTYLDLAQKGLM
jgi:tripartite-type tricarboxylate transporter receptor subunit TctC